MTALTQVSFNYDSPEFIDELNKAITEEYILSTEVEGLGGINLNISSPETLQTLCSKHGLETYYMSEEFADTEHQLLMWNLSNKDEGGKRSVMVLGYLPPPDGTAPMYH